MILDYLDSWLSKKGNSFIRVTSNEFPASCNSSVSKEKIRQRLAEIVFYFPESLIYATVHSSLK